MNIRKVSSFLAAIWIKAFLCLAVVKVRIQDHEIMDIVVLRHKASYMGQAETIAKEVCDKQTLEVDAISGATFTGRTVLKTIEDTLR